MTAAANCMIWIAIRTNSRIVRIPLSTRKYRRSSNASLKSGSGNTLIVSDAFPIYAQLDGQIPGVAPRIESLLIKPVSAICNLDCTYCFYLDRNADPYESLPGRRMSGETLERLVDTYLFYSYPRSTFVFQGGEPTLAGPAFFERLCALQKEHGRSGHIVSNGLQTNGMLLDDRWCD